ncbi:hypothetical protein DAMA08_023440 [Martiniozyma asiatica (nom. inval.)]|nr:hypothetical protein DAMA08_023440 [Martiniozyma asiatica]
MTAKQQEQEQEQEQEQMQEQMQTLVEEQERLLIPNQTLESKNFKSLTFINHNTAENTSVKNVNLKSELITETTETKKTRDLLFNGKISKIADKELDSRTISQKSGNNDTTEATLSQEERIVSNQDLNSVYPHSIYSFKNDAVVNKNIDKNFKQTNDNESFVYADLHSVDMASLADHKVYRKFSLNINTCNINHNFDHYNNNNSNNNNNNNNHNTNKSLSEKPTNALHNSRSLNVMQTHNLFSNANANCKECSELDFLDAQSIITTTTTTTTGIPNLNLFPDNQKYSILNGGGKSPKSKRTNMNFEYFGSADISVSPREQKLINNFTKVRHVKSKLNNQNFSILDGESIHDFGFSNSQNKQSRISTYDYINDNELGYNLIDSDLPLSRPFKKDLKLSNERTSLIRNTPNKKNHDYNSTKEFTIDEFKRSISRVNELTYQIDSDEDYDYDNINDDYDIVSTMTGYNNSPHNYKSSHYRHNFIIKILLTTMYIFIILFTLSAMFRIFVLKNFDNQLTLFNVTNLENILISEEILMLDITSQATNTNLQDVNIWNIDLDIFLATDENNLNENNLLMVKDNSINEFKILLGNTKMFLTPLKYDGIFTSSSWKQFFWNWNHIDSISSTNSTAQIKLYNPGHSFQYMGKNLSHEQWLTIFNSDFKLIVRGNIKYKLPMAHKQEVLGFNAEVNVHP